MPPWRRRSRTRPLRQVGRGQGQRQSRSRTRPLRQVGRGQGQRQSSSRVWPLRQVGHDQGQLQGGSRAWPLRQVGHDQGRSRGSRARPLRQVGRGQGRSQGLASITRWRGPMRERPGSCMAKSGWRRSLKLRRLTKPCRMRSLQYRQERRARQGPLEVGTWKPTSTRCGRSCSPSA